MVAPTRRWAVTYTTASFDPAHPEQTGRSTIEVTAHAAWSAAMLAQQRTKLDAGTIVSVVEVPSN